MIYEAAQQFREALLRRDRAAARALIRAYGVAEGRILASLEKLFERMRRAEAAGETINPAWLLQQERYQSLLEQIRREIGRVAGAAGRTITAAQREAAEHGAADALALAQSQADQAAVAVAFNRLPAPAVEAAVGFVGPGSPLARLLRQLPGEAAREVENRLIEGVALGHGPQKIARDVRQALGGNRRRALTIARTETARAYREAGHRLALDNEEFLAGWVWLSALNNRTCAACVALHGTFHPLSERMAAHVNCRCTRVDVLKGQSSPVPETGEAWFARQPEKIQREILADSPAALAAVQAGELSLRDFVGRRESAAWGPSYYQLSLKRARGGEGQFPGDAPRRDATARREKAPPIPAASPAVRARIEAATTGENVSVAALGLPQKVFQPVRGRSRDRVVEVRASDISLGREQLNRTRLDAVAAQLAGKRFERRRGFNIQVVRDQDDPARFVVSGDGNHRVAYLRLVEYDAPIRVTLVEPARR